MEKKIILKGMNELELQNYCINLSFPKFHGTQLFRWLYKNNYLDINNNNIMVPVPNLLGIFETYVYTKDTFDPAPRIIQECKYFNKDIIYLRDKNIQDGGSVYYKRKIKDIENDFI